MTAMVQRDRNHPWVVIWGIGNETEVFTEKGDPIARELRHRCVQWTAPAH